MSAVRYIARAPGVAARRIGGELMVMSGRDSSLFSLNSTAAALWDAADGTTPLESIVEQRICAEYEVDAGEALRDAQALVRELAGHGILLASGEPIPA